MNIANNQETYYLATMKAVLYGQRIEKGQEAYIRTLLRTIEKTDGEVVFESTFARKALDHGLEIEDYPTISTSEELKKEIPDFVITLGGDGTILNAITLVRDSNIPIVGINLGRLGFLASIEKSKIEMVVKELDEGRYSIGERSLIGLECNLDIFNNTKFALNDFTITKRDDSSMVKVKTYINGELLNVYWADGIIVATPTGSTGYSLSCGGPIIFPQSNNFVITPIAPHNLNVRPVVISDNAVITFEIEGRAEHFLSTLDSRFEKITTDHKITIRKCPFNIHLVKPQGITFMSTINSKLMWGLDMRN